MNISLSTLTELHFRAILAALMTRNGPARLPDFTRRLRFFKEETLQQREKELLDIRLEPPETLLSGFVFADAPADSHEDGFMRV